jgi:hypothetical protein
MLLDKVGKKFVAIDFGTAKNLQLHGIDGPISKKDLKLPKVKGGTSPALEFERILSWCLNQGYVVVCESPTIGSSGVEKKRIHNLMQEYEPWQLQTVSAHAVKNYLRDHGIPKDDHKQAAKIIYEIATAGAPERLHEWKYDETPLVRKHTSVRPMDKWGYKDQRSKTYLAKVPDDLPKEVVQYINVDKPARIIPFLMAFEEEGAETRAGYTKIIGAYEKRFPSFYSRNRIELVQEIAKDKAGVTTMAEVTKQQRTEAFRLAQKLIRKFYRHCKPNFIRVDGPNTFRKTDPADSVHSSSLYE